MKYTLPSLLNSCNSDFFISETASNPNKSFKLIKAFAFFKLAKTLFARFS